MSLPRFLVSPKNPKTPNPTPSLIAAWIPFFTLFAISGLFSANPSLSILKLTWAIFNITGAALVISTYQDSGSLTQGFRLAIFANALTLWIDSIFLQCLSRQPFLGFSMIGGTFENVQLFRPEAFYYEPSYAGSALAFAIPLLLVISNPQSKAALLFNALVMSAVVLTGSRTGYLCLFISMALILIFGIWKNKRELWGPVIKTSAAGLLLLCLFGLTSGGGRYFRFLWSDVVRPQKIYANLRANPIPTSESIRVNDFKKSVEDWKTHPWIGSGVDPDTGDTQRHLLQSTLTNTWMELAVEAGSLGLAAFLLAVGFNMRKALQNNQTGALRFFIIAAWFAHFTVNLNFTQTFPRLDYWLLFFFSIALMTRPKQEKL